MKINANLLYILHSNQINNIIQIHFVVENIEHFSSAKKVFGFHGFADENVVPRTREPWDTITYNNIQTNRIETTFM